MASRPIERSARSGIKVILHWHDHEFPVELLDDSVAKRGHTIGAISIEKHCLYYFSYARMWSSKRGKLHIRVDFMRGRTPIVE